MIIHKDDVIGFILIFIGITLFLVNIMSNIASPFVQIFGIGYQLFPVVLISYAGILVLVKKKQTRSFLSLVLLFLLFLPYLITTHTEILSSLDTSIFQNFLANSSIGKLFFDGFFLCLFIILVLNGVELIDSSQSSGKNNEQFDEFSDENFPDKNNEDEIPDPDNRGGGNEPEQTPDFSDSSDKRDDETFSEVNIVREPDQNDLTEIGNSKNGRIRETETSDYETNAPEDEIVSLSIDAFSPNGQKEEAPENTRNDQSIISNKETVKGRAGIPDRSADKEPEIQKPWKRPDNEFLTDLFPEPAKYKPLDKTLLKEKLEKTGQIIVKTLMDFNIQSKILEIHRGPTVTRFELYVDEKVNLLKIEKLKKNIAYNLSASKIRILAPIPGKKAIGIEVPNELKEIIYFADLINHKELFSSKTELPIFLGQDVDGKNIVLDLAQTPHLLVAGRTGSGKSVCINTIICSLVSMKTPDELKLILIDPKRVELSLYEELPHLLTDVITLPDMASKSLNWLVYEMEKRYEKMKNAKCRDIVSFNRQVEDTEKIPYLILIIDEFYALMQVAQKIIEDSLIRLSAMARAVGIHLIFATQRPSSDVVTGVIKSNLPSRISFQTTSKTDSRIILDENGAEELLGNGDMLYSLGGLPPVRVQGAFLSTAEVRSAVEKIVKTYEGYKKIDIIDEINSLTKPDDETYDDEAEDPLFEEALEIIKLEKKVSASYLQRRLKIGYNRAARLVELMEDKGYISEMKNDKTRDIFI